MISFEFQIETDTGCALRELQGFQRRKIILLAIFEYTQYSIPIHVLNIISITLCIIFSYENIDKLASRLQVSKHFQERRWKNTI